MVHFARLFVLDGTKDLSGARISAHLVFLTDLDAPLQRCLRRLADLAGDTLDQIYRAHRPLGNQNLARKAVYPELSKLRQGMNGDRRVEPTGDEARPRTTRTRGRRR